MTKSEKHEQFIDATLTMFELFVRNPDMFLIGKDFPDVRVSIAEVFIRAAAFRNPDLDADLLADAFAQAVNNYMDNLERHENEKREKEEAKWNGTAKSSVH